MKEETCGCSCHENKLKTPYSHDTECCKNMNGYIEQSFKEKKLAEFDEAVWLAKRLDGVDYEKVRTFLSESIEEAYKEGQKNKVPFIHTEASFNNQ